MGVAVRVESHVETVTLHCVRGVRYRTASDPSVGRRFAPVDFSIFERTDKTLDRSLGVADVDKALLSRHVGAPAGRLSRACGEGEGDQRHEPPCTGSQAHAVRSLLRTARTKPAPSRSKPRPTARGITCTTPPVVASNPVLTVVESVSVVDTPSTETSALNA